MSERPWAGRRIHLLGVGGAGMSAYARAAAALGAELSGSDERVTPYSQRLAADGVLDARIGYGAANLPQSADVEIYRSSAVGPTNPELQAALARGLHVRPRAQLLAQLTATRRTIAIAGTHGKSTTSAMVVHALRAAGMDPSWLIGATIGAGEANAHWGAGEWLVVEADESDRSMLSLTVEIAVVLNVELDHHAAYGSLAELEDAFAAFLARASAAVVIWDRPQLRALAARAGAVAVRAYELPAQTSVDGGRPRFGWCGQQVTLSVPGEHNVLDALAALEAAALAGAQPAAAAAGVAAFAGAGRRFQRLGASAAGAQIYDDYAHHPTEVAATLAAALTLAPARLVAVFQPHLYSRTELLAGDFGRALAAADVIVVLDVYAAREHAADHPGVSGLAVVRASADAVPGRPLYWMPQLGDARALLGALLRPGDLCLLMGAGDIDALGRALVAADEGSA